MSADGHIIAEAIDRNTQAISDLRNLIDRIWFGESDENGDTDGFDGVVDTLAEVSRRIREDEWAEKH